MPTVTFEYEDLCNLLGAEIGRERLLDLLELVKCPVERVEDGSITVEVTADRPDLFSVEGIARILRGLIGGKLKSPRAGRSKVEVRVSRSVRQVRPYIACAVVSGVKFTDASIAQLMQLQEKLHETLCRHRRKASIGIYDLGKVSPPITYTALRPEEIAFTPLDETKPMTAPQILAETAKGLEFRHLLEGLPRYPLLLDSKGHVLSMPPIINSEETKVTVETSSLFIDATGFNPEVLEQAVSIIALSLSERGAKVEAVKVKYEEGSRWTCTLKPRRVKAEASSINSLLGFRLSPARMASLLRRMGFQVKVRGERLEVDVPPYRCDILHWVDLAEDVALGFNYDKIKPEPLRLPTTGSLLPSTRLQRKIRDLMAGFGFQEVANYILSSREKQGEKMGVTVRLVELANPTTLEYEVLRCWLLPGLLDFLSKNTHVEYPQKIFELGDVVLPDLTRETSTRVECRLAAALTDFKAGYEDIQAVAYSLLRQLNVEGWRVEAVEHPSFIPGRAARLMVGDVEAMLLGELHPRVLEAFELQSPVAAMEANLTRFFPEYFDYERFNP